MVWVSKPIEFFILNNLNNYNMEVIDQIDDETFVISLKKDQQDKFFGRERIIIAHDYLRIIGSDLIHTGDKFYEKNGKSACLKSRHGLCSNTISVPVDVTIGIKSAQKILLPYLSKHKYMQPEHLADRIHTEDDKDWDAEWQKGKYSKPRWKKGDTYPCYSSSHEVMEYWEDGELMVEFSLAGEKNYSKVTAKVFNECIKPKIESREV